MNNKKIVLTAAFAVALAVVSLVVFLFLNKEKTISLKSSKAPQENVSASSSPKIVLKPLDKNLKELRITYVKKGKGDTVRSGDVVFVVYAGVLPDGKVFDTNMGKSPMGFIVGEGKLIKGWDKALVGLKEGDEVIIDIPADLAYGEKGVKGKDGKYIIPPNTPLRFDVLVVKRMSKEEADKMQQELLEKQKANSSASSSDKK